MNNKQVLVGIGIAIVDSELSDYDPNILLIQRGKNLDGKGLYGLPGGHMEFGETWQECATRELKEETNLDCTEFKQLGWVNYTTETGIQYVTLFVKGINWGGWLRNMEPEKHTVVKWVSLSKLQTMKIFVPLKKFLELPENYRKIVR